MGETWHRPSFDVTADGKFLPELDEEPAAQGDVNAIVVVHDWEQELPERNGSR